MRDRRPAPQTRQNKKRLLVHGGNQATRRGGRKYNTPPTHRLDPPKAVNPAMEQAREQLVKTNQHAPVCLRTEPYSLINLTVFGSGQCVHHSYGHSSRRRPPNPFSPLKSAVTSNRPVPPHQGFKSLALQPTSTKEEHTTSVVTRLARLRPSTTRPNDDAHFSPHNRCYM